MMIEQMIKFKLGYEIFCILMGLVVIGIYIICVFIGAIIKAMKEQKMPTDEEFIEFLRKINKHCENHGISCSGCKFYVGDDCQISCLADELKETPMAWDMEEIERIIRL